MSEFLTILICIGVLTLVWLYRTRSVPIALPWYSDRKDGAVTLALWDRSSPAVRADGASLPGARLLTPGERSAIEAGVKAWNSRLLQAGVPLRVKLVASQQADILVFGADSLADVKGRPLDCLTSLCIRDDNSPLARIERASIVITSSRIGMSDLRRALGIVAPARHGVADAKLLLAAYGLS